MLRRLRHAHRLLPRTATFKANQTVDLHVLISTNHYGRFEFRLCPANATADAQCTKLQRCGAAGLRTQRLAHNVHSLQLVVPTWRRAHTAPAQTPASRSGARPSAPAADACALLLCALPLRRLPSPHITERTAKARAGTCRQ